MSKITISSNICKGTEDCGICIFVCPKELFEPSDQMNERGYLVPRITDAKQCTVCLNCMVSCPDMAIVVEDKEKKAMEEK